MSGTAAPSLTPLQAQTVLQAIRDGLRIVLTSSTRMQPGSPLTATLVPATPLIDASELANGVLNLAWTGKNVLFNADDPISLPSQGDLEGDSLATGAGLLGGQPFPVPLSLAGASTAPVSTAAGLLGQVFGTVALPSLKVRLEVRWIVRNQGGFKLTEGQDFIAQQGLGSPSVSLVLPPLLRELRLDTLANPGGKVVCLSAEVTLTLGAEALLNFETPSVPVIVLPLLVPTLVAIFSESSFGLNADGAVLILVPEHSVFSSAEPLFKHLRRIQDAVDSLRGLASFVTFLVGLDELLGAVPDQPRLSFVAANGIGELGKHTIKKRPWYSFFGSDPDFDDKINSIFVFGLPGTRVEFFNDTGYQRSPDTDEGMYTIEVGNEHFVGVRTLTTNSHVKPVTFPPNRVTDFEEDTSFNNDEVWDTDMSSLQFEPLWLDALQAEISNPSPVPQLICKRPRPDTLSTGPGPAPAREGTRRPVSSGKKGGAPRRGTKRSR